MWVAFSTFITTMFNALTKGSTALDNAMGSLEDLSKVGKSKTGMMVTEQEHLATKLTQTLDQSAQKKFETITKARGLDILD